MATTEVTSVMKFKDADGNITAIYPVTRDYVTTTGDGSAYEATVKGVTALVAGTSFTMIPHVVSTSTSPTLNVNGLGAIRIRRRLNTNTTTTAAGYSDDWLSADKPVEVTYNGTFWIADLPKVSADDLLGSVPIANGGTGATTAAAARTNLGAVKMIRKTATLYVANWLYGYPQKVYFDTAIMGDSAFADFDTAVILVSPVVGSYETYTECNVRAIAQGGGTAGLPYISFKCDEVPSEDLEVNVVILT